MTTRRLGILQWAGLLAGAAAWAAAHILGVGLSLAECSPGSAHWGIENDTWETALLVVAALCVLGAGTASLLVLRATEGTRYDDPPRPGRPDRWAIPR